MWFSVLSDDATAISDLFETVGQEPSAGHLTVPAPNLELTDILHLKDIGRELSGKVVGPKAANLGQLNRMFPGRVAPAIAIPFGVYAQQLEARRGLMPRIRAAYADAGPAAGSTMKNSSAWLAQVRTDIAALTLGRVSFATRLIAGHGRGVRRARKVTACSCVRIPMSKTCRNSPVQVCRKPSPTWWVWRPSLARCPRVWSSVLSPRALAWRSSLLSNPDQVFASVLLMKSVPSDKSGVLVIGNLIDPLESGLTASTAWGVGGAVAGEAAESHRHSTRVSPAGLRSQGAVQTATVPTGGVDWLPAPAGRVLEAG